MRSLIVPGLILAFTVYCLVDVVRSESSDVRGLPKLAWVALVLLFPLAGGAAWFIAGRPRGSRPPGTGRIGTPRPTVLGPDDDPDFLRTIDRPRPVDPPRPLGPRTGSGSTAGPGVDRPGPEPGPTGQGAPGQHDEGAGDGPSDGPPDEREDPSGRDEHRP